MIVLVTAVLYAIDDVFSAISVY